MTRKPVRAVRALSTFKVPGIGDVYQGDLFRTDDPLVKGREQLFEDVNNLLGIAEQATRNPGQKRAARNPAPVPEPAAEPVFKAEAPPAPEPDESESEPQSEEG